MYFVCDSKKELADAIFEYSQKILVTDIEGNNMRLREFNVKEALELE